MNSKNRKTARESNKNNKTSSQRCFRNKKMKEVKILKLRLNYTSKHSLCERFTDK